MVDWIDYLTPDEAANIVATPEPRARYEGRNERGQKVTRYVAPTAAEMARIKARADG